MRVTLHKLQEQKAAERGEPTRESKQSMYDRMWRRYSRNFRSAKPLCVSCQQEGRTTPANVVDHVTPHGGDFGLFWDPANHQALCVRCHNTKSRREQMGGAG